MKKFPHWLRRTLALALSLLICLGLFTACDVVDMITKGGDLIDQFAQSPTDASNIVNNPTFPVFTFPSGSTQPAATQQTTLPAATTPPATTEPTFAIDPDNARYAVVTAEYLVAYKGPGQTYGQAGSLVYGDRIAVYGTDKGWAYTAIGWVQQSGIYMEGDTGEYAVGTGTVIGTDVNLRTGPSRDYEVVRRHNIGEQIEILEQIYADGLWWGFTGDGWICMDYVYVNKTLSSDHGVGTVIGDVVNVRSGPGTGHAVVTSVKEGTVLEIYKILTVKDVQWGCTDIGWICMDYIRYLRY